MNDQESDLQKKIREQFDSAPYPFIPIEKSPHQDIDWLYVHNLMTAFYLRNRKVIDTNGKLILDVGCGNGYTSLTLAEANPGAKIVGIDLSEESIKIARQRLAYHQFHQTEFHVLSLEEVASLCYEFDYINADEILYLLPDITAGLTVMKSVLKPEGIIRANLHSSLQRHLLFSCQEVFQIMGLMDENPEDFEIQLVKEIMSSLKDDVLVKAKIWIPCKLMYQDKDKILMNFLFQGDKGYTIPDLFASLRAADLEFINMVHWRQWELLDLFQYPENLPDFLIFKLPELSLEERLHLFELLHPTHRLLDFWCGHPCPQTSSQNLENWTDSDWQAVKIHLHPQLRTTKIQQDLCHCIENFTTFYFSKYLPNSSKFNLQVDSIQATVLLPLWERSCSLKFLVERWLQIQPVNPITLEPKTWETVWSELKELVTKLESALYLFLEQN